MPPSCDVSPSREGSCGIGCRFLPFTGSRGASAGKAAALPALPACSIPSAPAMDSWVTAWPDRGRCLGWRIRAGVCPGLYLYQDGRKKTEKQTPSRGTQDRQAPSDVGMLGVLPPSKCMTEKGQRTRGCGERERRPLPISALPARSYPLQRGKSRPERSHGTKLGFNLFQVRLHTLSSQAQGV